MIPIYTAEITLGGEPFYPLCAYEAYREGNGLTLAKVMDMSYEGVKTLIPYVPKTVEVVKKTNYFDFSILIAGQLTGWLQQIADESKSAVVCTAHPEKVLRLIMEHANIVSGTKSFYVPTNIRICNLTNLFFPDARVVSMEDRKNVNVKFLQDITGETDTQEALRKYVYTLYE
jgi:hypothetical protein